MSRASVRRRRCLPAVCGVISRWPSSRRRKAHRPGRESGREPRREAGPGRGADPFRGPARALGATGRCCSAPAATPLIRRSIERRHKSRKSRGERGKRPGRSREEAELPVRLFGQVAPVPGNDRGPVAGDGGCTSDRALRTVTRDLRFANSISVIRTEKRLSTAGVVTGVTRYSRTADLLRPRIPGRNRPGIQQGVVFRPVVRRPQ